jgi:alpha-L-arabinofuranosidase
MTLGTALRNARYLHVLMRHCDKTKIACRSNMANSFCGGIIETSPAGLLKRPSYYVMQLYARHAKPVPLKVEQGNDAPDVFVCASEDKKSVVIFAINSRAEPVNWSWQLDGFSGIAGAVQAEALCDTQDARQPDVMNHWNTPDRIKTVPVPVTSNQIVLPALSATVIECQIK